MATLVTDPPMPRPTTRDDFGIAVICALTLEADAVDALFDVHWDDDGPPFDKAPGDPNAYSTGAVGRHNVVLAHMPGMGKVNAAIVANNCRTSFPNIKLGLVVGIAGIVPFGPNGEEIILGDVIISNGVIQYDLGQRLPDHFAQKDTLLDSLGRPNHEIRALLAKLQGLRGLKSLAKDMAGYLDHLQLEPLLAAGYPGILYDSLFEAKYRHVGGNKPCNEAGCNGNLVPRRRLQSATNPVPVVHFGLIASGDSVMKSGEDRDAIARVGAVIAFEMEGAGVWDNFPCVVIKGACDYSDSHKSNKWQRYAAATAAACMKAFLNTWVPLSTTKPAGQHGPAVRHLIPYTSNPEFVGRSDVLTELENQLGPRQGTSGTSQARVSLFGLGGVGKTQIVISYVYWQQKSLPTTSIYWVHASNKERFRQSYADIARECQIPGYKDPNVNVLKLVKDWLTRLEHGHWLLVVDNADDMQLFFNQAADDTPNSAIRNEDSRLASYLPECAHGNILITTRNKRAGFRLTKGQPPIEVHPMTEAEAEKLLSTRLKDVSTSSTELLTLSSRLENLPLALVQSAAFINETGTTVSKYLELMSQSDEDVVTLLSREFETIGRDSEAPKAVAQTWILSFQKIEQQHTLASKLLSFISMFDRQDIPEEFLSHYCKRGQNESLYNEIDIIEAVGVLKGFSFITEKSNGTFDMHRLIQSVTRKWLINGGMMKVFWREALFSISNLYPYGTYENRTTCSAYLPHANAVLVGGNTTSKKEDEAKASLLHCLASHLDFKGDWRNAESLNIQAEKIRRTVFGTDHPDTISSMASLALTFCAQDRWEEAEKLNEKVVETCKIKFGPDHRNTLASMAYLAVSCRIQGRWEKAEKLQLQVMEIRKAKLGGDHPDTLMSMAHLASTYRSQGRWKEAEKFEVYVIENQKMKLGADHPSTLMSMAHLASTYSSQGWWEKAEKLQLQVMETQKTKLGADHPSTLRSMGNVASTYRSQGRWEEAEKLEVQVMETRKAKLGADHPFTLTSMAHLAHDWRSMGKFLDATKLLRECVNLESRVFGSNHPRTKLSVSMLELWETDGQMRRTLEV